MITKKSILFSFIIALLAQSCGLLPDTRPFIYQQTIIKNNTTKPLKINGFYVHASKFIIEIAPTSEFTYLDEYPSPIAYFSRVGVDSVTIKADSELYLIYCTNKPIEACNNPSYDFLYKRYIEQPVNEKIDKKRVKMKYLFEINEEDLEKLKP